MTQATEVKFNIGDKVRVTNSLPSNFTIDGYIKPGMVLTVTRIDGHYPVEAMDTRGHKYWFAAREVEKIGQEFKLNLHDTVRNLKTGRVGIVAAGLRVFDVKPPFRPGVNAKALEEYEFHHPGTYEIIKAGAPW